MTERRKPDWVALLALAILLALALWLWVGGGAWPLPDPQSFRFDTPSSSLLALSTIISL